MPQAPEPVAHYGGMGLVNLYALLGVLCTIELGVSFPKAGAWYVYARRAFRGTQVL
ncbi:MAG: hypothetical protein R2822_00020 [Spirosomataceae bacterium]